MDKVFFGLLLLFVAALNWSHYRIGGFEPAVISLLISIVLIQICSLGRSR
jgi:hypothetical protein